jgi:Zn-dependent protease
MSLLFNDLSSLFFFIAALLVAIDIHEFAHAWMADKLGDPTPRINGRLTLNPLAHLDPLGTLALFIFHIGWGKPVEIDPYNLRNPRRDAALISLAGPASNFLLAAALALLLHFLPPSQFLVNLIVLSVALGVFNLLPVPPLDGSKILLGFLPADLAHEWEKIFDQYGILILIFILFPFFGNQALVNLIVWPMINFILGLLLSPNLFLQVA